jgi:tetratricopeptide (TPR) repeat protein
VRGVINAPYTTDAERAQLRAFHGLWTADDLQNPTYAAVAAVLGGAWDERLFADDAPIVLRAEAALRRGEPEAALQLLFGDDSLRAVRLRTESYDALGRFDDARAEAEKARKALEDGPALSASQIVDAVQALRILAELNGEPTSEYQAMLDLLAQARARDRLYWPAILAEAELLYEKDDRESASKAVAEVIALNPKSAGAWRLLGNLHVGGFNIDAVRQVADTLDSFGRELTGDPSYTSPDAAILRARAWLRQSEPEEARVELEPLTVRFPTHREGVALRAAVAAAEYKPGELEDLLALSEELSPGSPDTLFAVGAALAEARQYEPAAEYLRLAIARQPNAPAPLIELGLLLLQSGEEIEALDRLRDVARLDPLNRRARNSLTLLEELVTYGTLESENFVVRYKPGVDEIMAREMVPLLEDIHTVVAGAFDHEPNRRTTVELMPNHQWFAVRITGMPDIHTIAAATGPVIAMEAPKIGPRHTGEYDWVRVVRHEYVHTITLSRTRNRIPHWFTEAAAVQYELAPRDYDTCLLLANALKSGELFDLQEINIAFVRPKKPSDRSQAYAQGHWMYEYILEKWGAQAPLDLMDLYADGVRESNAFRRVLDIEPEAFLAGFQEWARAQVESWGLAPTPSILALRLDAYAKNELGREVMRLALRDMAQRSAARLVGLPLGEPQGLELPPPSLDDARAWLNDYPDNPDALQVFLELALDENDGVASDELAPILERYAAARTVDPMPHRVLARHYLSSNTPSRAIPHLEYLDAREQRTAAFAAALAQRYEEISEYTLASEKAERATTIAPFDAELRELAARVALLRSDYATAERHIEALTVLEPEREIHKQRLERIRQIRGTLSTGL